MYMMTRNHHQDLTRNLWNSFFEPFNQSLNHQGTFRVDIRELENAYLLEAELPGVSEENISVQVDEDVLSISADMNLENKDETCMYSERQRGHMERSFQLEGVNQDGITAQLDQGLLRITLPKLEARRPEVRRIAISQAAPETPKIAEPDSGSENNDLYDQA